MCSRESRDNDDGTHFRESFMEVIDEINTEHLCQATNLVCSVTKHIYSQYLAIPFPCDK